MFSITITVVYCIEYTLYIVGVIPPLATVTRYKPDKKMNKKIFLHDGSVTDLECDVILIEANEKLDMKGTKTVR